MDREKVINAVEMAFDVWIDDSTGLSWFKEDEARHAKDEVLALLKEQEEREKAICKEICDFIRGSCSTDTYSDKEYVCNVVQQMFIKGWR